MLNLLKNGLKARQRIMNKNDVVYTNNKDGTLEKWYFICVENGWCYVRKGSKTKERWSDYIKYFGESEVYASRKDAMEARRRMTNND
jgi:hypothetical protein